MGRIKLVLVETRIVPSSGEPGLINRKRRWDDLFYAANACNIMQMNLPPMQSSVKLYNQCRQELIYPQSNLDIRV